MEIRDTIHFDWDELSKHSDKRLSAILGRDIDARSEQYDYCNWGLVVDQTPLTREEIELLFDTVNADDYDRERNSEDPVTAISQELAEKIILPLLPFEFDKSMADDDGVWFFGVIHNRHFDPSTETAEVVEDGVGLTRCTQCNTMIICDEDDQMPAVCPGCTRKLAYSAYKPQPDKPTCKCGCCIFNAHQVSHHDVETDGSGNFLKDHGIYHSDEPFGPFTCTQCGASYEELSDIAKGV